MITPKDIECKEFTMVKKGYSEDEVDEFLDLIIVDYESLLKENEELKEKLARGGSLEPAPEGEKTEASVYKTLEAAKSLMNDIAASAEHRAEILLKNAELDAQLITKEARESVSKYTEEGSRLKARVEALRDRYKEMLQAEMSRMDFTSNDLLAEFERDFMGGSAETKEVSAEISDKPEKTADLKKTIVAKKITIE